jgi:hypothetical protein
VRAARATRKGGLQARFQSSFGIGRLAEDVGRPIARLEARASP